MYKITSKMTLSEKLRAHANNLLEFDMILHVDPAWCMRDAANVIVCLNATINDLEDENERLSNRPKSMGEG